MSFQRRIGLVMALAGLFYFNIILAGMAGFSPLLWAAATALFMLWHLLLHAPFRTIPLAQVLVTVAFVAALCLGIGHGVGVLTGWRLDPRAPLGFALLITLLARGVNISPAQAADLQAKTEQLRNRRHGQ